MVIMSNSLAMNAERMLGITTKDVRKRSERLSSGYKINRSADDAAGLSISEKMRRQIRGLSQAAENIQDGISLCQVADGALNETADILQRMNELSVQAANGTKSLDDRRLIQTEIDQLITEVDRIANTTSFNDSVYPLRDGSVIQDTIINSESRVPDDPRIKIDSNGQLWKIPDQLQEFTINEIVTVNATTADGHVYNVGETLSLKVVGFEIDGGGYHYWRGDRAFGYVDQSFTTRTDGSSSMYSLDFNDIQVDTNGNLYTTNKENGITLYFIVIANGNNGNWYGFGYLDATPPADDSMLPFKDDSFIKATRYGDAPNIADNPNKDLTYGTNKDINSNNLQIYIQASADNIPDDKRIKIDLVNATCKGIGIEGLSVVQDGEAEQCIDKIKNAIKTVSQYRSNFGVTQNRLEHAYNINMNTVENTQYAESQIRDTDVATEMVKYANGKVLEQVGASMLAQANQINQNVLRLLSN